MKATELRRAMNEALTEAGVQKPDAEVLQLTECQLYRAVRGLMHKMDAKTSRLDPKRYGYKAVAGGMRELLELRDCDEKERRP